jgi:predicted ABC-type ATPase
VATKELIVVGGANGVGKTTFANEYVAGSGRASLSADAIAEQMSPSDPARSRTAAGREFLRQIRAAINGDDNFVVESTLSGRTFQHVLTKARVARYKIKIAYLFLHSDDECVERVRLRVQKGGHDVPEVDVRRRFTRSLWNFWNLYRELADDWVLMYNSGVEPHEVAVGTSGQFSISDLELFANFQRLIETIQS